MKLWVNRKILIYDSRLHNIVVWNCFTTMSRSQHGLICLRSASNHKKVPIILTGIKMDNLSIMLVLKSLTLGLCRYLQGGAVSFRCGRLNYLLEKIGCTFYVIHCQDIQINSWRGPDQLDLWVPASIMIDCWQLVPFTSFWKYPNGKWLPYCDKFKYMTNLYIPVEKSLRNLITCTLIYVNDLLWLQFFATCSPSTLDLLLVYRRQYRYLGSYMMGPQHWLGAHVLAVLQCEWLFCDTSCAFCF